MAAKVELFELIRRDSWHGGLSVRALAGKYGVHRRLEDRLRKLGYVDLG